MQNNKITSRPPTAQSTAEFIKGAEHGKTNDKDYPWQQPHVRADVQKILSLKIQEEYILKLKYISEKTNKSQQKIARDILYNGIDEILRTLT